MNVVLASPLIIRAEGMVRVRDAYIWKVAISCSTVQIKSALYATKYNATNVYGNWAIQEHRGLPRILPAHEQKVQPHRLSQL
jgi:hypothetical protein